MHRPDGNQTLLSLFHPVSRLTTVATYRQAGMWAQPPAVPPPGHYAPPTLPAPIPRDPMSFPPGLIPQLVRVRAQWL